MRFTSLNRSVSFQTPVDLYDYTSCAAVKITDVSLQETAQNSECRKPVLGRISKLEFSQMLCAADYLYFVFKR